MAMWKTFGNYMQNSGWTTALTQAGVASSGTATSFLRCCHLTRTRQAHQVTALALAKLQHDAFLSTQQGHTKEAKEVWRQDMIKSSPTFHYWDTVLHLELLGLIFIRSHRDKNFPLYVESLKALVPWFFALDHPNYSRWIPMHIRDMESLPPSISEEFLQQGHWVISKTTNRFSSMPIDQAHKQNNESVKGAGGAVGLTENSSAFQKWMLAGPEQARLLQEFEKESLSEETKRHLHHEESFATQRTFKQQALSLINTIKELGNPFLNDTQELLTLDTQDVVSDSVVNTIRNIELIGKKQYNDYRQLVLVERTRSIHEPIKKNCLQLFCSLTPKPRSRQADKIATLKADVDIFSRLYIVAQHRESDISTFFMHENHPYPPSISDRGKLRLGTKSDLLFCLKMVEKKDSLNALHTDELRDMDLLTCQEEEDEVVEVVDMQPEVNAPLETANKTEPPSTFDVKVLDGTAVLHFLPLAAIETFGDYAKKVFLPFIRNQLDSAKHLDVVWVTYRTDSIKETAREKRGKGVRRKVEAQNKIPGKWQDFLRDPDNKKELFAFLTNEIEHC